VQARTVGLSRFFVKFLEVAGAGLASAVCAYFLGQIQIGKPAAAPASPQQIAQVALAAGESVRVVQEAPASVVEAAPTEPQPQKDEPPKKPESTAAAPIAAPAPTATAAPAPKPAKPAHTAQPRRQQKPEQTPAADAKSQPQPVHPPVAADAKPPVPAAQSADAAATAPSGEDNRPLFAKLRLVPPWFSAGSDKPVERPAAERPMADVPRPPMPVGDALRSAM
jgi:outer membrane biosynthesis protein TonB